MTELVQHAGSSDLAQQMDYARAVSSGSMLPQAYRGKPADILIAVGLGQAMGLSPAESLYRIDVIQGKPTASAELIAANVRKAGHKLRVRGDERSCTATIVRADDPDFEFTVTRDVDWAKSMGLTSKDNYKKQPGTMLQWRAITAVARLACPEALYGVAYTADEMREGGALDVQPSQRVSAADFGAAPAMPEEDTVDADVVDESPAQEGWPNDLTDRTRKQLFSLFTQKGITERDKQLAGIRDVIGRPIASRSELTEDEAQACIERLRTLPDAEAQA